MRKIRHEDYIKRVSEECIYHSYTFYKYKCAFIKSNYDYRHVFALFTRYMGDEKRYF